MKTAKSYLWGEENSAWSLPNSPFLVLVNISEEAIHGQQINYCIVIYYFISNTKTTGFNDYFKWNYLNSIFHSFRLLSFQNLGFLNGINLCLDKCSICNLNIKTGHFEQARLNYC